MSPLFVLAIIDVRGNGSSIYARIEVTNNLIRGEELDDRMSAADRNESSDDEACAAAERTRCLSRAYESLKEWASADLAFSAC